MIRAAMAKQKKYMACERCTETGDYLDYIRKIELKEMTRNFCADFEHGPARNIKYNPTAFWKYSGTKLKTGP